MAAIRRSGNIGVRADNENAGRTRPLRADALLNRERLLAVAKIAFAEVGADISLEEIARRANVGIGTVYRNFPTRDAFIDAVYRFDVERLANAASQLHSSMPAVEALHKWMNLSVLCRRQTGPGVSTCPDDQPPHRNLQLFNRPAYASHDPACRAC
jgi:AcrR family transcriptional regulator